MIALRRRLFIRPVLREVAQAPTVLLMQPKPVDAWARAERHARDAHAAGDERASNHWYAVRAEVERRTGYRRNGDTATRYTEGG